MTEHTYEYPRPAVSTDCVLLAWHNDLLNILLIQRAHEPFQGHWALPGGFLDDDEDLDQAPVRELREETGLKNIPLRQLSAYGALNRDPRTRVITVVYLGMIRFADQTAVASDDASDARWFSIDQLPRLAFDHQQIVNDALNDLRLRLRCQPFGMELLPQEFSLDELRKLYESVLGQALNAARFDAQCERMDWLVTSDDDVTLYRFQPSQYADALNHGICFDPE